MIAKVWWEANMGNFASDIWQKWPNFPARARGARGFPLGIEGEAQIGPELMEKRLTSAKKSFKSAVNGAKNVQIAPKTLKTPLKHVKTALRAPKARAKNLPPKLPPPPAAGETPT